MVRNPAEERELIKKAVQGDEASFEALILSCKGRAYSLAYRYMNNEEDAQDVLQEAFIKIYRGLSSFNMDSSFDTWVYRIVVNAANDALRKRKKTAALQLIYTDDEDRNPAEEVPDDAPTPEEALESKEHENYITECLNKLDEEHRQVLILRDIQGFSYEEISDLTGCSLGTVKSRISRARKKFRDIYLEQK